jgi:hypothetical protein
MYNYFFIAGNKRRCVIVEEQKCSSSWSCFLPGLTTVYNTGIENGYLLLIIIYKFEQRVSQRN